MKDRPILFSAAMVQTILAGTKTQTRRVIKPDWWRCLDPADDEDRYRALGMCPYGRAGERLWVRETFSFDPDHDGDHTVSYRASGHEPQAGRWRPAIHMPRWASRITLEIAEVRIQRLQDISDADAEAEGIPEPKPSRHPGGDDTLSAREEFAELWDSINAARGCPWKSNPWVWCLSFRVVKTDEARGAA